MKPLVIGYGNSLRTDDGAGWHVARAMWDDSRFDDVSVVVSHQLVPELASDIAEASVAVFVDASVEVPGPPGTFAVRPVRVADAPMSQPSSHHTSPEALAVLAAGLFGRAPAMYVAGIVPESMQEGEELTEAVASALPAVLDAIAELLSTSNSPNSPTAGWLSTDGVSNHPEVGDEIDTTKERSS